MSGKKKSLLTLSVIIMTSLTAVHAQDVSVGISADYFGKYVWRGQVVTNAAVFQPGATIASEGFTFGIWGSMDTTNINGENDEFTEVDFSVDYSGDVPDVEGEKLQKMRGIL